MKILGSYPKTRLRRLRKSSWIRNLVSENNISHNDLVLPIFGPTNFRDLLGLIGDRALNPFIKPWNVIDRRDRRLTYGVGRVVVNSPEISDRYLQMKGTAIDPYGALKSAYTQYRNSAIQE